MTPPEASVLNEKLNDEERSVVEEEERLLSAARAALADAQPRRGEDAAHSKLSSLRGDLSSGTTDDQAAIAAEAARVRATAGVQQRGQLVDLALPYFAHMQLESNGRVRDILLGQSTFIQAKKRVTIVDWREAPIAQVFFHYAEGDDYEQEAPDRIIEGVLRKRRILTFEAGELAQIQTPNYALRRGEDGEWEREQSSEQPRLEGGEGGELAKRIIGTGQAGEKLPVISSLLDEEQYEALTLDAERPLLILGGAGCGKTTVALHRLAYLSYQDPETYAPESLIVIVPEEGLVRLTRALLAELSMEQVSVTTIDNWFAQQAARLFPSLPTKLALSTPPQVMRLKRHPALCALLPEIARDAARAAATEVDRELHAEGEFTSLFETSSKEFPLGRLEEARAAWIKRRPKDEHKNIRAVIREAIAKFLDPDRDREQIFGDRTLLERAVENANGDVSASTIDRLIERYLIQVSMTSEEEYAHVDARRRSTVDGLSLDAGTPTEDASSIDVEDFALLIELYRLKTGKPLAAGGTVEPYSHVVLDEAQELSEVELVVLGRTVATQGSVTVAGDSAQQIGQGSEFFGWDHSMDALGHGRAAPVTLTTSYRCTRPILDFGRAVLGRLAPDEVPTVVKEGAPISKSQMPNEMHAAILLGDALNELLTREPSAQVAIIAREDDTALRLHHSLRQQLPLRLVLDGRFTFEPGIDVTSVSQVKGLEFDYVIVPDASDLAYPDDPNSRRMLHVAATRAIHQLWVLTNGRWSALVPD